MNSLKKKEIIPYIALSIIDIIGNIVTNIKFEDKNFSDANILNIIFCTKPNKK